MVYQFSLAPLLLEAPAQRRRHAAGATGWPRWSRPPPGTTTLNFTASHDGIGVRPLEGLMPPERFARLIEAVIRRGGRVSTRRNPDGSESPYELNITYFSALAVGHGSPTGRKLGLKPRDTALSVRRFLASQALMLALRGVPARVLPQSCGDAQRRGRRRSAPAAPDRSTAGSSTPRNSGGALAARFAPGRGARRLSPDAGRPDRPAGVPPRGRPAGDRRRRAIAGRLSCGPVSTTGSGSSSWPTSAAETGPSTSAA